MITYDPFWEPLKPKGITQYKLLNDYNFSHGTYYHIRELSDTLCKDHNLSVINPSQNKGKSYKEWQAEKNGTSLKVTLRKDIDDAINSCSSYEDFIALMKERDMK